MKSIIRDNFYNLLAELRNILLIFLLIGCLKILVFQMKAERSSRSKWKLSVRKVKQCSRVAFLILLKKSPNSSRRSWEEYLVSVVSKCQLPKKVVSH